MIDKSNWGVLVTTACMHTNYSLSVFIMKIHLYSFVKHTEIPM